MGRLGQKRTLLPIPTSRRYLSGNHIAGSTEAHEAVTRHLERHLMESAMGAGLVVMAHRRMAPVPARPYEISYTENVGWVFVIPSHLLHLAGLRWRRHVLDLQGVLQMGNKGRLMYSYDTRKGWLVFLYGAVSATLDYLRSMFICKKT